jgi:hypothetical protein
VVRTGNSDRNVLVRRWLCPPISLDPGPNSSFQIEFVSRPNDQIFVEGDDIERFNDSYFNRLNVLIQVGVAGLVDLQFDCDHASLDASSINLVIISFFWVHSFQAIGAVFLPN